MLGDTMKTMGPLVLGLALLCLAAAAKAADTGLAGYWPFDGSLADASGAGLDAKGEAPGFAPGHVGQALDPNWNPVTIASAESLQLNVGLTLDCWVYFAQKPKGYEQIVYKDREYQLRVDDVSEGGRFSFFVYLGGWEPRVSGPVPQAGHWYHLTARWTGTEAVLQVDDETFAGARLGVPVATDSPVSVGAASARIDDLRIANPVLFRNRQLQALVKGVPDARRSASATFGGAEGWDGWQGLGGAQVQPVRGEMAARLPGDAAMLVAPGLEVPLGPSKWVSLDLDAPGAAMAQLTFITDHGMGMAIVPVWGGGRTSLVDLSSMPQWTGTLKLLGVSFSDGKPHQVSLRRLWVSREPEGSSYVYVRSLAPGRAVLRAGREESVVAAVRNLGKMAHQVKVQLVAPAGVSILDEAVKTIPDLDYESVELVTWKVRADKPLAGARFDARVLGGQDGTGKSMTAAFTPPPRLPPADYVPPPRPVRSKYLMLMHYCPLWKEGTHYGWGKIEPWPERRPAIGWYDEGTPEVADWHIKYALEHGIQGFIYCWYRDGFSPEIKQALGHAIHDGLMNARYRDQLKFAIMWENGCGTGCSSREDVLDNLMPFWMGNYFKHPSYVKIDNKPLLYIWVPQNLARDVGGWENVRGTLDAMREACRREGFDGLWIVGCVGGADEDVLRHMGEAGFDASSAYGVAMPQSKVRGRDMDGMPTDDYRTAVLGQEAAWRGKKTIGALPDIVDLMMGWDPRPWSGKSGGSYIGGASPAVFEQACRRMKALVDATPGNGLDRRVVVFDNWCEFGEGHYLEPTSGFGFAYVDAIKRVFCPDAPPCQDITPADVGLAYPEHVYLAGREALGGLPTRTRHVVGNLVAWYRFEDDDTAITQDSSACGFSGAKQGFVATEGKVGKGFLCQGGSISVGAHKLFFPPEGITVELWMKPAEPGQSDRWMVNTVGAADTGYRLGLGDGKIVWQIPQTEWSHNLTCPTPVEVGKWHHVAATYDGRMMRVYVDGEEAASLPRDGAINPSGANLCIGSYAPGNARAFFQGVLDEVRIYNRALTPAEIREHAGE
jgi:hypothetical protein